LDKVNPQAKSADKLPCVWIPEIAKIQEYTKGSFLFKEGKLVMSRRWKP
jgi:hypothetical protein